MAFVVKAYCVMAYIAMAYVVMAYVVMACTVMAAPTEGRGVGAVRTNNNFVCGLCVGRTIASKSRRAPRLRSSSSAMHEVDRNTCLYSYVCVVTADVVIAYVVMVCRLSAYIVMATNFLVRHACSRTFRRIQRV